MRFLHKRGDTVDQGRMDEKFTARERAHAYFVLDGQISLLRHPYDRDPGSGSGNCWCGYHQSHVIHEIVEIPQSKGE
jgi:hypothetical protein